MRSVERRGESGAKQSRSDARIEWAPVASMFVNKMDVDKEVEKPVELANRGRDKVSRDPGLGIIRSQLSGDKAGGSPCGSRD